MTPMESEQTEGPLLKLFKDKKFAFLVVGGFNTIFSMGLNIVLRHAIPMSVPSAVVSFFNGLISMVLVFFAYRKFVFKVQGNILQDFLRYTTTSVSAILFNVVMQGFFADYLKFPPVPVIIGVTAIQVVLSYFAHNKFSFRRKEEQNNES
ncbi:MAG: GtrA family protein [Micrococcaceae bacterium]